MKSETADLRDHHRNRKQNSYGIQRCLADQLHPSYCVFSVGVFHKAVRKVKNYFTNDLNMASQKEFSIIVNRISQR